MPEIVSMVLFFVMVGAAGLGGFALLRVVGLDDVEAWAGGRIAGLVLAAVPAWWCGVAGLACWRAVGTGVLGCAAVAGAVTAWRRRRAWVQLLIGEGIFTGAALLVLVMRLDRPEILQTEKPMDLGILASLLRAESFPPPDMWLAGETLPYYYWGSLLWVVPIEASGIPPEVAYNLAVACIGGLMAATVWMLGRAMGGGHPAGLTAAFFAVFAGTPDGLRQLLAGTGVLGLDLWASSRQIPDTITEFPLFSLWLGDLHPHLLSIPVAVLALLVALRAGRAGSVARSAPLLAVLLGVTWAANPWAMPPTAAGIGLMLVAGDGGARWPLGRSARRWAWVLAITAGGWLAFVPFHLSFAPPFRGLGLVRSATSPLQMLLYGGTLLVPACGAALASVRRTAFGDRFLGRARSLVVCAFVVLAAAASGRPALVMLAAVLGMLAAALFEPDLEDDRAGLALAALGVFLLLVPEIVFVHDPYGDRLHRMNTVFKAYIQAWIFLAAAMPVMVRRMVSSRGRRLVVLGLLLLPTLPHLVSAVARPVAAGRPGVDGLRWMDSGDRALVRCLREQPPGVTLVEAVGDAYSDFSRLSAASGVPALIGWENHESVWRGGDVLAETGRRTKAVERIYRSGDPAEVRAVAAEWGVDLVAIGVIERREYPAAGLEAVIAGGEILLEGHGAVLVHMTEGGE